MICTSDSPNGFRSDALSSYWIVLHTDSLTYPVHPTKKQQQDTHQWFIATLNRLPCETCKSNIQQNLTEIHFDKDIDFASRTAYSWCVYNLHTKVNEKLNKPNISFLEMCNKFEKCRSSQACTTSGESCSR